MRIGSLVGALVIWACSMPIGQARVLSLHSFDQKDGLTDLNVKAVKQDDVGYIYAGTEHGLYVFDGIRFIALGPAEGLPDGGDIKDVVVTASGRLIVNYSNIAYASLNKTGRDVSPLALRFVQVEGSATNARRNLLGRMVAWGNGAVAISHGALFLIEPDGARAFVMKGAAGSIPPAARSPPLQASSLYRSGDDLFAGTADGRICRLSTYRLDCFGREAGVPEQRWAAFLTDGRHGLLARSATSLIRLDIDDHRARAEALPDQAASSSRSYEANLTLLRSPKGELVTQVGDHLLIRAGLKWITVGPTNGLPDAPIYTIDFDRSGRLWLSAAGRGLSVVQGYGDWENYDRSDGLASNIVWQIRRQPNGPVWLATDQGTVALSDAGPMLPRINFPGQSVALAIGDRDHVWRSLGANAVSCLMTRTGKTVDFAMPFANRIVRRRDGTIFFLTDDGIFETDDELEIPERPRRLGSTSGVFSDGTVDTDGTLWVISDGRLIHMGKDGSARTILNKWLEPAFVPVVLAMDGPDTFWIGGSGGGLKRVHLKDGTVDRIDTIGPPQVASTSVEALVVDRDHRVWAGTDNGLSVSNGDRWVSVNQNNGLVWNDLTQSGLFQDEDGSMWIGTSNGVSHLLQPSALFRQPTPEPVIVSVTIAGRSYADSAVRFTQDPLDFRFGALGPTLVARFRYRLDGVDKDWADTGQGEARYALVPPGHHRFELIAYDPLTHQASEPVSMMIRMKRPMWQWWPFLAAYASMAFGAVYASWRLRYGLLMRQQRKLHREVERQTREIRAAQEALVLQASQDSLTKLLTRGEIQKRVDERLTEERHVCGLTIGLVDIDHFKRINDHFGHLAGDDVLREMGSRLRDALREGEAAGRYGGEEILVVLPHGGEIGVARIRALKEAVCAESFLIEVELVRVTCSIGVATAIGQDDWKSLIGRADRALYQAKAEGRDRIVEAQKTQFSFQGPATVR